MALFSTCKSSICIMINSAQALSRLPGAQSRRYSEPAPGALGRAIPLECNQAKLGKRYPQANWTNMVRWRTNRSRVRCSIRIDCCSASALNRTQTASSAW